MRTDPVPGSRLPDVEVPGYRAIAAGQYGSRLWPTAIPRREFLSRVLVTEVLDAGQASHDDAG